MDYYLGSIEDGKVVKAGLLYYISPNTGDNVFRHMNRVMKTLPDVIKNKGQWYWAKPGKKRGDFEYEEREIEGAISALIIVTGINGIKVMFYTSALRLIVIESSAEV